MSINIFSALRTTAYVALLGDSRVAQIHADAAFLRQSGYNHFNWGNNRAGNRVTISTNQGNSGDRTDQFLARLGTCISSGAGTLYLLGGVNDVAQAFTGYTTANTIGPNQGIAVTLSNVASVAVSMLQYIIQRWIGSGGQRVILCLDPGSENYTTSQIGALMDFNQRLKETAETYPGIILFDLCKEMHDPTASSTSTIRFHSGYAQEASGSGTHESNLGAYKVGVDFATLLTANFPATAFLPSDVNEIPSNSLSSLLTNPLMIGTAGTVSAGVTGSAPTGWTVARYSGGSGTQTATSAVQAAADGGPGNECVITPTFSAAGDGFLIKQDVTIGNVNVGDIVQAMARVTVDAGGVALAATWIDFEYNDGTTTHLIASLAPLNNNAIGTDGYTVDMKTEKYTILAKTGSPFLTLRVNIIGSGSGAGPAVRIKQMQIRKRFS